MKTRIYATPAVKGLNNKILLDHPDPRQPRVLSVGPKYNIVEVKMCFQMCENCYTCYIMHIDLIVHFIRRQID